jgi:hypothetical protein
MDTHFIGKVALDEVIADFRDYLITERGFKELADALPNEYLAQEFEYIAKGTVNRHYLNMHEHLERTREIFTSFSDETAAEAEDLADEMYILLRDEFGPGFSKTKAVYTVSRVNDNLCINLLASGEAVHYGIDLKSLAEQVS